MPSENYEDEKLIIPKYNLSDKSWPSNGKVVFNNFSLKYRDYCDLALNNINLEINSGEKIGIVGRTGSGKSSLVLALFELLKLLMEKLKLMGKIYVIYH